MKVWFAVSVLCILLSACRPCKVSVLDRKVRTCAEKQANGRAIDWMELERSKLGLVGLPLLTKLKRNPDEVTGEWLDSLIAYPDTTPAIFQRWLDDSAPGQWFSLNATYREEGWSTERQVYFDFDANLRLIAVAIYDIDGGSLGKFYPEHK